jgi:transcriptional regulator with XRE-family HTH domain
MTLGEFLKVQRESNQWKQPEAAQKIEIAQSYLSKLENDKAVPSADIFDRLMAVYQFSMQQISEVVQSSELEKLKDIVVVREFILSTRKRRDKDKRRFLLAGVVMSMLGGLLLSFGVVMHDYDERSYIYESKGILKPTDNDYVFMGMPEYQLFKVIMRNNDAYTKELQQRPIFDRLDYQQQIQELDLGAFYTAEIEGGKRRFQLVKMSKKSNKVPFYIGMSLGIMLLVGSVSLFYVSRRW